MFDAIVIGGSYAGMAAALQLARARRKVAVIDGGKRRNRFAAAAHGFLSRDGEAPDKIALEARAQLLAYPTVTWMDGAVAAASGGFDAFDAALASGGSAQGRRLILAHGVVDELPGIPGLAELWGRRVFHCPYCHGYELNKGALGVLATGPHSLHQALMLPDWGRTTLFTNGAFVPDATEATQLAARGVAVEERPVVAAGEATDKVTLRLADGELRALDGLFVATRLHLASPLAAGLGCAIEEGPLGATIRTDAFKETTVPGVYACGDAARMAGSLSFAVADGMMAGTAAHRSLMFAGL